jgi:hypothetical protein
LECGKQPSFNAKRGSRFALTNRLLVGALDALNGSVAAAKGLVV